MQFTQGCLGIPKQSAQPVLAKASLTSSQSVSNAVESDATLAVLDDRLSLINTVNNTISFPFGGLYLVWITAGFNAVASGQGYIGYRINGGTTYRLFQFPLNGSVAQGFTGFDVVRVNPRDSIEFRIFQNSSGGLAFSTATFAGIASLSLNP